MKQKRKIQIRAHGIRVLLSGHPDIRRLKRLHSPSVHGNKVWTSSWLLMEFFQRKGLGRRKRVMEIGSGWGLAGIHCAKRHRSRVTAVDIDDEVFPFLRLHAEKNHVNIMTMKRSFDGLRVRDLEGYDVLMGADICFWDSMVDPLIRLVKRALRAGVGTILIADPGRGPFDTLSSHFRENGNGKIHVLTTQRPRRIQGSILRITGPR